MSRQMRDCGTCGHATPEGNFCVRCGAPLNAPLGHSRQRAQFAAAPGERRRVPHPISTLFPQLPRHAERGFRIVIVGGAVLIAALAAERLFGVALISAALLMPLITLVYLYDVDVYRESPGWAIAWTVGWGVIAGIGTGFLTKALAPTGAALIDKSSTGQVLVGGLLIPAIGVGLMLAGPLVLLPYRRYNETLDGATFGSASAVAFAAAEAVVVASGVLAGGLRPPGAALPWVARLLALGVATPVLAMSAVGFAAAALWLRFRPPATDRRALGVLGAPPLAVALALAFVVAGAAFETFLSVELWLVWLIVLDLVALVGLREALHVGLLEEAGERDIGSLVRCANCGAQTAVHTFCGNCGIALKALPNARRDAGAGEAEVTRIFDGRLGAGARGLGWRLGAGGALVAGAAGLAVAVVALSAAPVRRAPCQPGVPCGAPPLPHLVVGPTPAIFPGYTSWHAAAGMSLRYESSEFSVASQGPDDLVLQARQGSSEVALHAVRGAVTPSALIAAQRSALGARLLGLSTDRNAADQVLGTNVGLVPGPGAVLRGTTNLPQAPDSPVLVDLMAARSGVVGVVATVITPVDDPGDQTTVFFEADDILDSVTFPGT